MSAKADYDCNKNGVENNLKRKEARLRIEYSLLMNIKNIKNRKQNGDSYAGDCRYNNVAVFLSVLSVDFILFWELPVLKGKEDRNPDKNNRKYQPLGATFSDALRKPLDYTQEYPAD